MRDPDTDTGCHPPAGEVPPRATRRSHTSLAALCLALPAVLSPPQDEPLASRAEAGLKRAATWFHSISTNGGYAGIYSPDLKERYGEATYERAAPTEIWVQPPGTPSVGERFLWAHRVTGDPDYLTYAVDAGQALAWGQRSAGGWDHRVDVAGLERGLAGHEQPSGRCTLDDNISQGALDFLMSLDRVVDEDWLSQAVELGLAFLEQSQFENGAWPQWYPLRGGYHDHYTFNDNAINDCIRVLLRAHELYGREALLECAERGGDFIILSQIAAPQPGWAQQYSHDLEPAWARKFEPPAVCSAVTARNLHTLVALYRYTGKEEYLAPIPAAIDWLDRSRLDDDLWARFYEVGSNRPIYGDRDGESHYELEEISEERRRGYAWRGGFGVRGAIRTYREVREAGTDHGDSVDGSPPSRVARLAKAAELAPRVEQVLAALDAEGRWLRDGMLRSAVFVENSGVLCSYLELTRN